MKVIEATCTIYGAEYHRIIQCPDADVLRVLQNLKSEHEKTMHALYGCKGETFRRRRQLQIANDLFFNGTRHNWADCLPPGFPYKKFKNVNPLPVEGKLTITVR